MFRKAFNQLKFALQARAASLLFVGFLLVTAIIDWASGWIILDQIKSSWDKDISQLVAFSTLGIAVSVWWSELAQDWRNKLPKRLTVDFVYQVGNEWRVVMRCKEAHLTEMADIRSLSQQIGSQLANPVNPVRNLSFRAPMVRQRDTKINFRKEIGFYRYFHVEMLLNELPAELQPDECRIWRKPFGKEDIDTCEALQTTSPIEKNS